MTQQFASEFGEWLGENWRSALAVLMALAFFYSEFEGMRRTLAESVRAKESLIAVNTQMRIDVAGMTRDVSDLRGEYQRTRDRLNIMREQISKLEAAVGRLEARMGRSQ